MASEGVIHAVLIVAIFQQIKLINKLIPLSFGNTIQLMIYRFYCTYQVITEKNSGSRMTFLHKRGWICRYFFRSSSVINFQLYQILFCNVNCLLQVVLIITLSLLHLIDFDVFILYSMSKMIKDIMFYRKFGEIIP